MNSPFYDDFRGEVSPLPGPTRPVVKKQHYNNFIIVFRGRRRDDSPFVMKLSNKIDMSVDKQSSCFPNYHLPRN